MGAWVCSSSFLGGYNGGGMVMLRPLLFWHETAMNTSALQTRLQGKQSNDDDVLLFVFVCEIYIYCLHYAAAAAPEKIAFL